MTRAQIILKTQLMLSLIMVKPIPNQKGETR
jgi:hypothetical protein